MSLVTSLALDLPKLITREPPPCIWFMMNRKISTMMTMGRKLTSRLTRKLSWGTSVAKLSVFLASTCACSSSVSLLP